MNLDAEDLAAIAETVTQSLNKVPRDLKDVLDTIPWTFNLPIKSPANYATIKVNATNEGVWVSFELNNYRLFERFYLYSDEYKFPKRP